MIAKAVIHLIIDCSAEQHRSRTKVGWTENVAGQNALPYLIDDENDQFERDRALGLILDLARDHDMN